MGLIAEALLALPAKFYGFVYYPRVVFLFCHRRVGFILHFNFYLLPQQILKQPANGHCALRAGSYPYIVNGSFAVMVYFFTNAFVYLLASKHLT